MLQTSTLRPGFLVSLKTSLRGNVSYRTVDIEPDHNLENGERRAVWETTRTVYDANEQERAVKARSKCRSIVTGVCAQSAFGLLCPEANADNLQRAIADANNVARMFNEKASVTRLAFFVLVGRVASDDLSAMRAINSEVRDLLSDMESGVKNLDAAAIRDAANKANSIGKMLTPEAAERLQASIDAVRKQARAITKAGETAAVEIDATVFKQLEESRTAFLEIGDDVQTPIAAPDAEGRGVDFDAVPQQSGFVPAPFTMPGIE